MRRAAHAVLLTCCIQSCSIDSAQPAMEHRWLRLGDGDSLHYAATGSGRDTIVVLGGGPGWSTSYLRQPFAGLARDHGIIFLDLRGRGKSSAVDDTLSVGLETDLGDLAALHSGLKLGSVILAGHGYGAGLAAMYAERHERRVSRLILLSPMFSHVNLVWQASFQPNDSVAIPRYLTALRLGHDSVDPAGFCREFWGFELSPVEETDSLVLAGLGADVCDGPPANLEAMGRMSRAIRRSLGSWDWRDSLTRIEVPALIVQGDGNLFLLRTAQTWSQLLPHSSFIALPGNSHFPWTTAASTFQRSLHDFLSRTSVSASRQPSRDKAVTAGQR